MPRFQREDYDRLFDLEPIYLRKSDAEIAWERRRPRLRRTDAAIDPERCT